MQPTSLSARAPEAARRHPRRVVPAALTLLALLLTFFCSGHQAEAQMPRLYSSRPKVLIPQIEAARLLEERKPRPVHQVLVKLKPGVAPEEFARRFSAQTLAKNGELAQITVAKAVPTLTYKRSHPKLGWHVFRLPSPDALPYALEALRNDPQTLRAEPDVAIKTLDIGPPNDHYYNLPDTDHLNGVLSGFSGPGLESRQYDSSYWYYSWHLLMTNAENGWNVYPGKYYTAQDRKNLIQTDPARIPKVAVLDTGIDFTHPDFNYVGDTPQNATNNDIKNGGQINVSLARKFAGGNRTSDPSLAADQIGHGTGVSGIIAAATNNGRGMSGMGYPAQIVPIQVISPDGADESDFLDAITYAVDNGCVLINTSLQLDTTVYLQALQDAVDYAWNHGTLIVSAAGNDGINGNPATPNPVDPLVGQTRRYPASCYHVLAVAASTWPGITTDLDANGNPIDFPSVADPERLASYSNFGYSLGVAAPGGDITRFINTSDQGSQFLNPIDEYVLMWTLAPTYLTQFTDPNFAYTAIGIYDDANNTGYGYLPGTSFACPVVTGLAALYVAKNKITQATPNGPQKIITAIERGARPFNTPFGPREITETDGGFNTQYGYGVIDAESTMNDANPRHATSGGIIGQVTVGGTVVNNVQVVAQKSNSTKKYYAATFPDGIFHFVNLPSGTYTLTTSAFGYRGAQTATIQVGADVHGVNFPLGPPPPVTVAVTPKNVIVPFGTKQQFTATVTNNANTNVIWSLPVDAGGTIDPTGLLAAPLKAAASQQALVKATSVADPSAYDTATVTFQPGSLTPMADAYVNAGSASGNNYGTSTMLVVKKVSNTNNGLNRATYLKFDLSQMLIAPTTATLNLMTCNPTAPSSKTVVVDVYSVANTSWTESGITYKNAPGMSIYTFTSTGTLVTSQNVTLTAYKPVTFDLTAFVAANLGKVVTLQLMEDTVYDTNMNLCFFSKESANKPSLTFTY